MARRSGKHIILASNLKHPEKFKAPIVEKNQTFTINGQKFEVSAGDKYPVICRSRWEMMFVQYCDSNQDVLEWASEPYPIPYTNPVKKRQSVYVPDFLVAVRQQNGRIVKMLIEIKPAKEALNERARSAIDTAKVIENQAKWKAAEWWCQRRGIMFRIMTEHDLFGAPQPKAKVPRKAR